MASAATACCRFSSDKGAVLGSRTTTGWRTALHFRHVWANKEPAGQQRGRSPPGRQLLVGGSTIDMTHYHNADDSAFDREP